MAAAAAGRTPRSAKGLLQLSLSTLLGSHVYLLQQISLHTLPSANPHPGPRAPPTPLHPSSLAATSFTRSLPPPCAHLLSPHLCWVCLWVVPLFPSSLTDDAPVLLLSCPAHAALPPSACESIKPCAVKAEYTMTSTVGQCIR